MGSALAILGETGRTDFTVLEVVERSRTSLRAFYQHFATKDELLLAPVAKVLAPLHQLVADILRRGIAEATFRADLHVDTDAAILMQTALGAMRLRDLGTELTGVPIDGGHIYRLCLRGLFLTP